MYCISHKYKYLVNNARYERARKLYIPQYFSKLI